MRQVKFGHVITIGVAVLFLAGIVYLLVPKSREADVPNVNRPAFSESATLGQALFDTHCVACHGAYATGSKQGPPLIHPFYRPRHHDDTAIVRAIKNGVIAHHWQFGDMAPVTGLSDSEVIDLISFLRELQRANGIH